MLSDSSGLCLLNAFETKQSYGQTLTFNSNIPALSTFPKFLTDTSNNYNSLLFNLATLCCLHKAYTACFSIKWTTTGISSLLLVCSLLFVFPLPAPFEFWCYCRIYFSQKSFTIVSVYLIKLIY